MRLPLKTRLTCRIHRRLYDYDRRELFSDDKYLISRLRYLERFESVIGLVRSLLERRSIILDVGCAQGNFSIKLAEEGYEVCAIDVCHDSLTYAKLKDYTGRVHLIRASGDKLPIKERVFDAVLLGEVLDQVAHPSLFLTATYNCLRNNGFVVVTAPNGDYLFSKRPRYSQFQDKSVLEKNQFGATPESRLFCLTVHECLMLLLQCGFSVKKCFYVISAPINEVTSKLMRLFGISPKEIIRIDKTIANLGRIGKYFSGHFVWPGSPDRKQLFKQADSEWA